MKILVRVDIKEELPPANEVLCENKHGDRGYGHYVEMNNHCEGNFVLVYDVTHWYKEAELERYDGMGAYIVKYKN